MKLGDKITDKYHPDFECVDEVRIRTVPRWKDSHLSGSEWRISAHVEMYCKGVLVHESDWRNVETACLALGGEWCKASDNGLPFMEFRDKCMQPGCVEVATRTFVLKNEFSRQGERLDQSEVFGQHQRRFCDRHSHRGDCGMEDSDANYIELPPTAPPAQGEESR